MRPFCLLLALLLLEAVGSNPARAQEGLVVERLIRLEEGQKGLGQRIEDTNQRIDDLRADMNQRSEDLRTDMNQRFADLNFWLQMTFGAVFATRRTTRVTERLEAHLAETEKDRLLTFQREEIGLLKERLERLEQALQRG